MKADFDYHKCSILLYPERKDVWRSEAKFIRQTILELAKVMSTFELVFIGYNRHHQFEKNESNMVKNFYAAYNDIWSRDTVGVPLYGDNLAVFQFDAWGGLYTKTTDDLMLPKTIAELLSLNIKKSHLILEGGNLISDGRGTLLAVKEPIIKRNLFPLEKIELELKQVLNINQIIWIERGLIYDETGGHVDNLCVFADTNTILLSWTDDKNNIQYPIVREALAVLEKANNIDGQLYKIIKIPTPDIIIRTDEDCEGLEYRKDSKNRFVGELIQASYINFIFINGGIIVPQFGIKQDKDALEVFRKFFKAKTVIPFNAREIILGGGGIHCISRNI